MVIHLKFGILFHDVVLMLVTLALQDLPLLLQLEKLILELLRSHLILLSLLQKLLPLVGREGF